MKAQYGLFYEHDNGVCGVALDKRRETDFTNDVVLVSFMSVRLSNVSGRLSFVKLAFVHYYKE